MKNKPQYAFLENKEVWPRPVILHLASGVIGYPWMIKHEDSERIEQAIEDIAQQRNIGAKVSGYSIFVTYSGTTSIPAPEKDELLEIVWGMADFFKSYSIDPKPNRYVTYSDNYYKGCPGDWKPLTPEQLAAKKAKKDRPE